MDGPGWLAPRNISPLGRSPSGGHAGHRGPVPHDILGDTETRPWETPLDNSKLSKTHAFRALCACTKEFAAEWKAPAGLGSKHALFYGCSKNSKTHYFRALFSVHQETASSNGNPNSKYFKIFHTLRGRPLAATTDNAGPLRTIS